MELYSFSKDSNTSALFVDVPDFVDANADANASAMDKFPVELVCALV